MLDEKGNLIKVCLFENYLAKFFLENSEIFLPLLKKIFIELDRVIQENVETPQFDRKLFSIFTIIKCLDPAINNFEQLKQTKSLIVIDTFLKFFSETVLKMPGIKLTKGDPACIERRLRPLALFAPEHRGVKPIKSRAVTVSYLGILKEEHTPSDLIDCVPLHEKSRALYKALPKSRVAVWLRSHHLPIISGASGSIGITLGGLSSMMDLSSNDYYLLGLLIAASTIALGHHSFFEVILPLAHSLLIKPIEEKEILLEFYEQIIPLHIRESDVYIKYIHSSKGAILIQNPALEDIAMPSPTQSLF